MAGISPRLCPDFLFALAGQREREGCHMQQSELFPLEAVPPQVRRVILSEFHGRRPSVQEITQLSDRHWLATPGVGPTVLAKMRSITQPPQQQDDPGLSRLTDAELLDRLEFVQEELRWIQRTLKAEIRKPARNEDGFDSHDRVGSGSTKELSL
jgi:hypothetical protein